MFFFLFVCFFLNCDSLHFCLPLQIWCGELCDRANSVMCLVRLWGTTSATMTSVCPGSHGTAPSVPWTPSLLPSSSMRAEGEHSSCFLFTRWGALVLVSPSRREGFYFSTVRGSLSLTLHKDVGGIEGPNKLSCPNYTIESSIPKILLGWY